CDPPDLVPRLLSEPQVRVWPGRDPTGDAGGGGDRDLPESLEDRDRSSRRRGTHYDPGHEPSRQQRADDGITAHRTPSFLAATPFRPQASPLSRAGRGVGLESHKTWEAQEHS